MVNRPQTSFVRLCAQGFGVQEVLEDVMGESNSVSVPEWNAMRGLVGVIKAPELCLPIGKE